MVAIQVYRCGGKILVRLGNEVVARPHECTIGDSESILFAKSLKLKLLICRIAQRYHVIRKMAPLIHCFVILVIE